MGPLSPICHDVAMTQQDVVARLRAAGSIFAEDEAALLLGEARDPAELELMTGRRVAGEPLEVVLGWAELCGQRVAVEAGVFVPRARTAVLVEEGVRGLRAGSVVVDLCCGTGAVGVVIASRVDVELYASDIDPAAVSCARRNVEPLGGTVLAGDLLEALPTTLWGRVDLLVVNAPYVPTDAIALMPREARDHEPRVALDGGRDGVDLHRRVASSARDWLAPEGRLLIETSERQAPLTEAAFRAGGLVPRTVRAEHVDGAAVVGHRGVGTA
jgi:release factor glutamine methyltransferase